MRNYLLPASLSYRTPFTTVDGLCCHTLCPYTIDHKHPAPHPVGGSPPHMPTIKAAPTVLVVDVLREAVLLEQLMGRMLKLGQGLRGAAIASNSRSSLRGTGAAHKRASSTHSFVTRQQTTQWSHAPLCNTHLFVPPVTAPTPSLGPELQSILLERKPTFPDKLYLIRSKLQNFTAPSRMRQVPAPSAAT